MGVLVEVQPFQYTIIEKASKRKGVLMTLEGVFQRADVKNANNRIYPRNLWDKIMADEETNTRITNRRMVGELDHPPSGSTSSHRVSHVVTEHKLLSDGEIRGRMEVLDTPAGRIAKTMFDAGVQLGVSSRGDGSVERHGDVSKVQEDFKLNTYDIVLNPSTTGAYPQIIESEEKTKENNNLIASAVEGLVKSTDDLEVLLECHKIISVLEGCESRCETILKDLKTKIRPSDEPLTQTAIEEKTMQVENQNGNIVTTPPVTAATFPPELASFLKEQVDRGVADAVKEKDDQISELNQRIVNLTQQKEDTDKKLTAAEQLIEEFQRKVEELAESKSTDESLQKRYDAAVKLLDEAIGKLQVLGDTQRRLDAAQSLLSASIDRHREEAVSKAVDNQLSDLDESVAEKIRPLLETCSTPDEVSKRYEELSALIETAAGQKPVVKEPLPSPQTEITEEIRKAEPRTAHSNYIVNRLLNRVGVAG